MTFFLLWPTKEPSECDEKRMQIGGLIGKMGKSSKALLTVGRRRSHCPLVLVLGKDSEDSIGDRAIATGFHWLSHSEGAARSTVAHDRSLQNESVLLLRRFRCMVSKQRGS